MANVALFGVTRTWSGGLTPMAIDTEKLIDRVLIARPDASPDDVRLLAPALAHLPQAELVARLTKARRRKQRNSGVRE